MTSYEHRGQVPSIDPTAWVAPNATLSGDVVVGPGARVLYGAVLSAEDGQVRIGPDTVVLDNAVIRGRAGHPATIAGAVMVGPHAHVNGADVAEGCFLATGASLFPGCRLEPGVEVRINGVVHANTVVAAGAVVPIGWVAVGDPAQILPPDRHDEIWAVQRTLDFPGTVYGLPPDSPPTVRMATQSRWYGEHVHDRVHEP